MWVIISQRQDKNKYGELIDSLESDYMRYLGKFNINIISIPNFPSKVLDYFQLPISGIILSGGNDIGESPDRDETEKKLLEIAIEKKLPVLGICRGMQFINVFFKGKLTDVENHVKQNHRVDIIENKDFLGESMEVNSYHNYAVTSSVLSPELKAFAKISNSDVIEGIYHPFLPIAGIQWHPERESPDEEANQKIIECFLQKRLFWEKKKIKAIILAAGKGTRLKKYTENLPKCMLSFKGKSLIERQIETLRACGINDIIIVKGFMSEKIQIPGIKYYINEDFENTNMVETLFQAEPEMDDEILVCYSDILYEKKVIEKILQSEADIGVTIDADYWDYWKARLDEPEKDTESLVIEEGRIIELGDTNCSQDKAKVRYVGLIKFSKKGVEALKKVYHENKEKYYDSDESWLRSKSFKKAYMTCMLQALINEGYKVEPIIINRGWMEFDTEEDYEKADQWLKTGFIKNFIDLEN